jgi:DnaJ-domain-containing protein 1
LKLNQHTVCLYEYLEGRLRSSLIGAIKGELGISAKQYRAKTKVAEQRRTHNRQQIRSYYGSLEREIDSALLGVSDKEGFLVNLFTDFQVTKTGWIKTITNYRLQIHPAAVFSEGKISTRKREKSLAIIGKMAKQSLDRMAKEAAKEFGLKPIYYEEVKDVPLPSRNDVSTESGVLICGAFYPLVSKRRVRVGMTFRNKKDLRSAIMEQLAPQYVISDDKWSCSFADVMTIQRSVNTLVDWGMTNLNKTGDLDKKIKTARGAFDQVYSHLPKTSDYAALVTKIETLRAAFSEIEKNYRDAKSRWRAAARIRLTDPEKSVMMQEEEIRTIEACGQRINDEVLTELENALKSNHSTSRLDSIRSALDKAAYAVDWVQRFVFLAGGIMSAFPVKPL